MSQPYWGVLLLSLLTGCATTLTVADATERAGVVHVGMPADNAVANLPVALVKCQYHVGIIAPADSAENTLYTCRIPAGTLGPNGSLRIWTLWTLTNNPNTKNVRMKFGGRTFFASGSALANIAAWRMFWSVSNRNATNSQISFIGLGETPFGIGGAASNVTANVDTSVAQDLVITCQKEVARDACVLDSVVVESLYGQ